MSHIVGAAGLGFLLPLFCVFAIIAGANIIAIGVGRWFVGGFVAGVVTWTLILSILVRVAKS